MKKEIYIGLFIILFIFSSSFVSASLFDDFIDRLKGFFGKEDTTPPPYTRKVIESEHVKEGQELLVKFRGSADRNAVDSVLNKAGVVRARKIDQINVLILEIPNAKSDKALINAKLEILSGDPRVEFAEKNLGVKGGVYPNDPYLGYEWFIDNVNLPSGWDIHQGVPTVIIAIGDSGIDTDHPDLVGKFYSGWNYVSDNDDIEDTFWHGTAVAGVAAAKTNNGEGIAAGGWQNMLYITRVLSDEDLAYFSDIAQSITDSADFGARIYSSSITNTYRSSTIKLAAEYFNDRGGVVFACGGANTGSFLDYPDMLSVIHVGATEQGDQLASFSDYGPYIDLVAPGNNIYTTSLGGFYSYNGGCSFATPLVAGIAALVISANPSLTPIQVEYILERTAMDLGPTGWDQEYGWGRVDAASALLMAVNMISVDECIFGEIQCTGQPGPEYYKKCMDCDEDGATEWCYRPYPGGPSFRCGYVGDTYVADEVCQAGGCVPMEGSCAYFGYECGSQSLCGEMTDCGTCETGEICQFGECIGPSGESCRTLGLECGMHTVGGNNKFCGACDDCNECTGDICNYIQQGVEAYCTYPIEAEGTSCTSCGGDNCVCHAGECVNPNYCINECILGDTYCEDQFTLRECGLYDYDFCTEFGSTTCLAGTECVDIDLGFKNVSECVPCLENPPAEEQFCDSIGYECGFAYLCRQRVNCGTCNESGTTCSAGECVDCTNWTCEDFGYECGMHDICGSYVDCGGCSEGQVCGCASTAFPDIQDDRCYEDYICVTPRNPSPDSGKPGPIVKTPTPTEGLSPPYESPLLRLVKDVLLKIKNFFGYSQPT